MDFDKSSTQDNKGPYEDNAVIKIRSLTVWTPEETSWWRRRVTKPKTVILNNGCINNGDLVAVLGPSGAGKTTFLVSIAGKCNLPSKGSVIINGANVRDTPGVAEIVPQHTIFMDNLTVTEHLVFMTEMKLGSCKMPYNRKKMNALIKELKLAAHAQTLISCLSGGQKKLLSLATSLISSPKILICDEPTTGLDSYSAALVVLVLKKIAMSGKIVVCSVHQPSSDLFKEFGSVMLMSEGRLLFHGTLNECRNMFESINLKCPKNYNPAEFYIRAISSSQVEKIKERVAYSSTELTNTQPSVPEKKFQIYQRHWLKQVHLLLWRVTVSWNRNIKSHLIELLFSLIISGVVIATCFTGTTGDTQRGVQDMRGFLWLLCGELCFTLSYSALFIFETELTLFKREAGMYKASAYFIARFLSLIPRCIIWTVVFVTITTISVQFPNHIMTALEFLAALLVCSVTSTAYGLGMGALFMSTGVISDVMPCFDLPLFLMSGAFIRISSLPTWLLPVKYISHFYYAMDAVSNIYWRQVDFIACPSNSTSSCVKDGTAVLTENGYSDDFILQDGVGLVSLTVIWSVFAYCGLRREERKGYAY